MHRSYHRWHSPALGRDMELLLFGHAGTPSSSFRPRWARFSSTKTSGMIDALAEKLEQRRVAAVLRRDRRCRELLQTPPSARPHRPVPALRALPAGGRRAVRPPGQRAPSHRRSPGAASARITRSRWRCAIRTSFTCVRHDGRRLRRLAVPRRLLRPGRLLCSPRRTFCRISPTRGFSIATAGTSGCS